MTRITDHPRYAMLLHAWIVAIVYNPLLTDPAYLERVYPDGVARPVTDDDIELVAVGLFSRN